MAFNMMWGLKGQSAETKSGTRYTPDSGGFISSIAANDIIDMLDNGCVPMSVGGVIGRLLNFDLNATAGADVAIPLMVPTGARYNITKIWGIANVDAHLTVKVGFYTAASAGGTAIITSAVLTSLTASTVFASMGTIASAAVVLTANPIYAHLDTALGSAGTVDIFVYGDVLG